MHAQLLGTDVVAHQHYLAQVAAMLNTHSLVEVKKIHPRVDFRFLNSQGDEFELSLKGMKPIVGDTLYHFVRNDTGRQVVLAHLRGEFRRLEHVHSS
jgi:hypothetical protein